jgi:hypothetical protein
MSKFKIPKLISDFFLTGSKYLILANGNATTGTSVLSTYLVLHKNAHDTLSVKLGEALAGISSANDVSLRI